jgi:hypothetical protein
VRYPEPTPLRPPPSRALACNTPLPARTRALRPHARSLLHAIIGYKPADLCQHACAHPSSTIVTSGHLTVSRTCASVTARAGRPSKCSSSKCCFSSRWAGRRCIRWFPSICMHRQA